jgi:hypothetical protein
VLPHRVHLTVPAAWRRRRLRVPRGLVLHHAGVPRPDRNWAGPVPVTSPERTLLDCVDAHVAPDLVAQAIEQAGARGLVGPDGLAEIARAMNPAEVSR